MAGHMLWLGILEPLRSTFNTLLRPLRKFLVGHPAAMEAMSDTILKVFEEKCFSAGQMGLHQGIVNWIVLFAPEAVQQGFRLEVV